RATRGGEPPRTWRQAGRLSAAALAERARARRAAGAAVEDQQRRGASRSGGPTAATPRLKSGHDGIQEIPTGAILDLDNPDVGIEFELARQIALGVDV